MNKALGIMLLFQGVLACLSANAQTQLPVDYGDPVLTVRQLPNAQYEAVVTYGTNKACVYTVNPPISIEVDGTSISVESTTFLPTPCIGMPPPPTFFIEQSAGLGELLAGEYTVDWLQPDNFSLTTTFEATGLAPEPIANSNPYPESGLWYNPDESGTGFDLEFQGGVMAGHYFGYDSNGDSEWYLVSGALQQSAATETMWELEVEPQRYSGGNCLGCTFRPPDPPDLLASIKFEFLQRGQLKLTLSDGSVQYMVPIVYGDTIMPVAGENLTQNLPQFASGSSRWVVVFNDYNNETQTSSLSESAVLQVDSPQVLGNTSGDIILLYSLTKILSQDDQVFYFGDISCHLGDNPVCYLQSHGRTAFEIPVGNFTDSRFFGNNGNSDTVQGFRLDYD